MKNIRQFVEEISIQYDKIDVLVNNAATVFEPFKETPEGIETTLATNYLGMYSKATGGSIYVVLVNFRTFFTDTFALLVIEKGRQWR